MVSESVGDLYFQAKPVLISCGPIKRRALEIAVEVRGHSKDLILIEIFSEGPKTIREIFLGKKRATAIVLYEYVFKEIYFPMLIFLIGTSETKSRKANSKYSSVLKKSN